MLNQRHRAPSAFTLIEIMAVVIIIGLLAAIVITAVQSHVVKARVTLNKTQIREIVKSLELFRLQNSFYPSTEQGLQALVSKPTTGRLPKEWTAPYMDELPKDPYGNAYVYTSPGAEGRSYDIVSYGADGAPGGTGEDQDVESWKLNEK